MLDVAPETTDARQRPWTSKELDALRRLAAAGLGREAIAEHLGRSDRSVRDKASRLGISLRRTGSRAGAILGAPRGERYITERETARRLQHLAQIREDISAGKIDPADLERQLRALAAGADLCPECTRNVIDIPRKGICTACHRRRQADEHLMLIDAAASARDAHAAQQDYWRARKASSRAEAPKRKDPPQ